jgi:hypothetical protein
MIATNAQISRTLMQEILVMSTLANARRATRGMSIQSGLFMFTTIPDAIIRYSPYSSSLHNLVKNKFLKLIRINDKIRKLVAKLVTRLLFTAALWVQIQTSLKNTKWAT